MELRVCPSLELKETRGRPGSDGSGSGSEGDGGGEETLGRTLRRMRRGRKNKRRKRRGRSQAVMSRFFFQTETVLLNKHFKPNKLNK